MLCYWSGSLRRKLCTSCHFQDLNFIIFNHLSSSRPQNGWFCHNKERARIFSWIATSCMMTTRDFSTYSSHLPDKFMKKLLNKKGAKAKRRWYEPHLAEPMEAIGQKGKLSKSSQRVASEAQRTRARQLSHVLYDRITSIVSTGELSQDVLDKQVIITEVKIHPNFQGVNVVWDARRWDAEEVERLLQAHAGKLRSLLISYHVLGKIPPIFFVRNKSTSHGDLNELLKMADYGPDYEPSHPGRVEADDKDADQGGEESDQELSGERIPVASELFAEEGLTYRIDLYGLPVEVLMSKIKSKKTKLKSTPEDMATRFDVITQKERLKKLSEMTLSQKKIKRYQEARKIKELGLERDVDDVG